MPQVVLIDADTFLPPDHFDGFSVERPLGRGGMGHVYLGRDVELDRMVALKFVRAEKENVNARERFRREARAIARLSHPNVVGIYRIGEVEEQPYIAYELVAGKSLDRTAMPLPWPIALRIAVGVARGLEAVHRAGILHRDLKPANIVLSDTGDVKLIDFGLASLNAEPEAPVDPSTLPSPTARTVENLHLTRPGAILGTPAYIAPEQWCGQAATMRSDIFSLGMTFLELLTGTLPHAGLPFDDIAKFLLLRDIPPLRTSRPDIPESFASIIDRCLRKDPAERFASGTEVRAVLETAERIFIQAGAGSPAGALDLASNHVVVASSFVRVKSKGARFARTLYDRLFELAPEVRGLFPADMSAQEKKLLHMIEVAIDALSQPEVLDAVLADLGRRHVHYGAKVEHFTVLWQALLEALAEHEGDAWTPALAAAWKETLATLETRMRRGMELEKATVISGTGHVNVNVLRLPPPIFDLRQASTPEPTDSWRAPRTQYARREGEEIDVAYQVFGSGPVDVVLSLGWVSHVELNWGHRAFMSFLKEIGRWARVVTYDKRGTGLSDRSREAATLDDHVADLLLVCEEAKLARPVLFGVGDGAAISLVASALHPDHFSGLVLYGATPKLVAAPDFPHGIGADVLARVERTIKERWGEAILLDLQAPSMASDGAFRDWLSLYLRMAASPANAWALMREHARRDIRPILPHVQLPALVLHRTNDPAVPIAAGRWLAKQLPNARFASLEGVDHLPFVGATSDLLELAETFVTQRVHGESVVLPPSPLRFVAAFRDLAEPGNELAREVADALGGVPLGREGGVIAYAFTRIQRAIVFLQRLGESSDGGGHSRLAVEALPLGPTERPTAIATMTRLLEEAASSASRSPLSASSPTPVKIGPVALGFLGGSASADRP